MNSILTRIRKLNWVLSNINDRDWAYNQLCQIYCEILEANVYVIDDKGKVLGVVYQNILDTSTYTDPGTGEEKIPDEHFQNISKIKEPLGNLCGDEIVKYFGQDYEMPEKYHTIVPIINSDRRFGTMIFARYEKLFTEEDLALCEYGSTVIGLEMRRRKEEEEYQEERLRDAVDMAIESLSYSEVEAVVRIFENVEDDEVILVASKIADAYNITRSVVVNALRKLESAGVVTSRSLGMKGTRIKITNKYLRSEIGKIKLH